MSPRDRYLQLATALERAERAGSTTGVLIYYVLLARHLRRCIRKGLLYWNHKAYEP